MPENEATKKFTDEQLVAQYLQLRRFIEAEADAQQKHIEPYQKGMEAISGLLHQRLLDRNPNWKPGVSAAGSTAAGTFFLKTLKSVKMADRKAFHDFLFDLYDEANRNEDEAALEQVRGFLTAHVAKEAVEAYTEELLKYQEEHGALPAGVESAIPPGITIDNIVQCQIRKS